MKNANCVPARCSPLPHLLRKCRCYFFLESSSSRLCSSSFKPSQKRSSSWQQKVKLGEHHFRSTTASGQCLTSEECSPPSFHPCLLRTLFDVVKRLLTALRSELCHKIHHSTLSILLLYLLSQLIKTHNNSAYITTSSYSKSAWHPEMALW